MCILHTYSSMQGKKVIIMGGKTSTTAKNRYNAKAYDQIPLRVPKGQKEVIQEHAKSQGESTNAFITRAIRETMQKDGADISVLDVEE